MIELLATIVFLGARARHFDEEQRIDDGVGIVVVSLRSAADHADVRIGVESTRLDADAHVRRLHAARPIMKRAGQDRDDVCRVGSMLGGTTGHRVDLAVQVFVPDVAVFLETQILGNRVLPVRRPNCHDCSLPPLSPIGIGGRGFFPPGRSGGTSSCASSSARERTPSFAAARASNTRTVTSEMPRAYAVSFVDWPIAR